MTADRAIEAHATLVTLETRALALWKQEVRDRRWMGADWSPARHNRRTLLLELLAIRRTGRRLARETLERAPVYASAR